jgi:hypothetical protein
MPDTANLAFVAACRTKTAGLKFGQFYGTRLPENRPQRTQITKNPKKRLRRIYSGSTKMSKLQCELESLAGKPREPAA